MENRNIQIGPGFFGLLTIVFIVLKLTEVIDWSWWWVLAPLWGQAVFFILIMIISVIVIAIGELF